MPRYIDADKLIEMANHEGAFGYIDVYDICAIPEADVAEIVPCRKCKFYKRTGSFYGLCKHRQWNETIKKIDSMLNWILFDDLVNRIACIIHEAEKGTYNEKV